MSWQKLIFGIFVFTFVFLLIGRLFYLDVVRGSYYQDLSQGNRVKIRYELAPRGIIYDQNEGILVRNTPQGRKYIYSQLLSHLLGYIAEADLDDLEADEGLSLGDAVGKMGVEREYDVLLRGQKAERLLEYDADGEVVREISYQAPIAGDSLRLYLDLSIQQEAKKAMGDKMGAVIISRPGGEVLAMLSNPSFDPNQFTIATSSSTIGSILTDTTMPLFNRAISGLYPPGSTFKPVTAIAGLEEGKINASTVFEDVGNLCFGEWCFGNWYYLQYGRTEGEVDLVKAIKRSNDIYFYQAGRLLGINLLSDWAKHFGFGKTTGIDIPGEDRGLFPSSKWKEEFKGESWYLGDTLITSIGQGNILTTPIQVHQLATTLANQGILCPPQILAETRASLEGSKWKQPPKKECQDLHIKTENLALVQSGMQQACEPGGTAWPLFNFGIGGESTGSAEFKKISVACKTGTAEFSDPQDQTHAWFIAYAPIEKPEIVVTVLAEKAGEGSTDAAPIAKHILKYYFTKQNLI